MRALLSLRVSSAVLAAAIGLVPVAPPAHVHETTTPGGHHEALTHRHAELHLSHGASADHDRTTAEDAESVVATLDLVSTPPGSGFAPNRSLPIVSFVLHEPELLSRAVRCEFIERLIHGPPHASTSPRGPPAQSFL